MSLKNFLVIWKP